MSDTIVFDLETKKSFDEVGGRENYHLLGVSVLCAYSYERDRFYAFEEKDLGHFEKMLEEASKVIGYNIKGFDLPVLQPYTSLKLVPLPTLDLMEDITEGAGFRVSLDNLSEATLGQRKSAHGLQALEWYKDGKIEEIKKYCTDDVRLTRDLYEFGRKNGHVLFYSREAAGRIAVPVHWSEASPDARRILEDALAQKRSVEIDYVTRSSDSSDPFRKKRVVDIYKIDNDFFEGYCHLRKGLRVFKINRVLGARLTERSYQMTGETQSKLL